MAARIPGAATRNNLHRSSPSAASAAVACHNPPMLYDTAARAAGSRMGVELAHTQASAGASVVAPVVAGRTVVAAEQRVARRWVCRTGR